MRGIFQAGNNRFRSTHGARLAGFTLIELLVVLVLLGVSLSIVGPRIGQVQDTARFNNSLRSVVTTARAARSRARTEQREVAVEFDVADRTYTLDNGAEREIRPRDTRVEVTAPESEKLSDTRIAIRFFPDGSATGGSVRLGLADRNSLISIDWLTGLATLDP